MLGNILDSKVQGLAVEVADKAIAGLDFAGVIADREMYKGRHALVSEALDHNNVNIRVFESRSKGNAYKDFLPLELKALLSYAQAQIPIISTKFADSLLEDRPDSSATMCLLSER